MRRVGYILLLVALLGGCSAVTVRDWDVYVYNCEVKLDWDEGEVTCEWEI